MLASPTGTRGLVAPELLPGLDLFPSFALDAGNLAEARAAGADFPMPPLSPAQQAVHCEERRVPGPAGAPDVRVLVYRPADAGGTPRPGYLHVHGGGYVAGAPEMADAGNRALVADLGCVVVSVDYRLAPETRAPGAVEDCHAALVWLAREADALGVDRSRIAIGGESAGGGLAAALAILARDRGEVAICLQMLDSPMLDDRTVIADANPHAGEFVWTPALNRFGWHSLLGVEPGGTDVPAYAVPARTENLAGLAPAFIVVGAIDLFVDEDIAYAQKLIRAGVPTELHVVPGAFHGFMMAGDSPQSRMQLRLAHAALERAFGRTRSAATGPA